MRSLLLVAALLFTSFSSITSFAQVQEYKTDYSCGSTQIQGVDFSYCIRNVDRSKNKDIVYFFHGLMGSEKTWFTQVLGTKMIERMWHYAGYDPTVVTVSFGGVWLLVNNEQYPLIPFFANAVVPFLEQQVGGIGNGRRFLIGQSMGGFNAAEASLQIPGMFQKVALLCPAITTVGPFATQDEIDAYMQRTKADPHLVKLMLDISRQVFTDEADWEKQDPLRLLTHYPSPLKPQYFVSTGVADEFGFQEGSELFARIGKANGFKTQWTPKSGGHCNFDRQGTANFFLKE